MSGAGDRSFVLAGDSNAPTFFMRVGLTMSEARR